MTKTINFDGIPSGDFEPLPVDRYILKCVEATLGKSKAGKDKISTTFEIQDEEYKNRKVWHEFSLQEAAWFNLKNYFAAAKVDASGDIEFKNLPGMMLNTVVSAFLEQSTYEGKTSNKVKNWGAVDEDTALWS